METVVEVKAKVTIEMSSDEFVTMYRMLKQHKREVLDKLPDGAVSHETNMIFVELGMLYENLERRF